MWELDSIAIVGAGRLGHAFAAALRAGGMRVDGPLGRGADARGADAVLLCVPDGEIAAAAGAVAPGPPVGHCSGATGLDVLAPHAAFSVHPLMTVPPGASLGGAAAAVDGSTPAALAAAGAVAAAAGLRAFRVAGPDRAAYHAAAAAAANFVTTVLGMAERLGTTAGVDRAALAPLARAAVDHWTERGAAAALTGPVARGDDATVAGHREAVTARTPDLLPLFDALVQATRGLATGGDRP